MDAQAVDPVHLAYPVRGRWRAENSPARRVPSHGTHLLGETYAVDLVGVDARGRSTPRRVPPLLGVEPPEQYVGFGRPVLAPRSGTVVLAHDGEEDHGARRSQMILLRYMASQRGRLQRGTAGLAGNHVVIEVGGVGADGAEGEQGPRARQGVFVLLAHLRRGSIAVEVGDQVRIGDQVAVCGNSGNSTQPHLHVQVTDSVDWDRARGIPMVFDHPNAPLMPRERQIVDL